MKSLFFLGVCALCAAMGWEAARYSDQVRISAAYMEGHRQGLSFAERLSVTSPYSGYTWFENLRLTELDLADLRAQFAVNQQELQKQKNRRQVLRLRIEARRLLEEQINRSPEIKANPEERR